MDHPHLTLALQLAEDGYVVLSADHLECVKIMLDHVDRAAAEGLALRFGGSLTLEGNGWRIAAPTVVLYGVLESARAVSS